VLHGSGTGVHEYGVLGFTRTDPLSFRVTSSPLHVAANLATG